VAQELKQFRAEEKCVPAWGISGTDPQLDKRIAFGSLRLLTEPKPPDRLPDEQYNAAHCGVSQEGGALVVSLVLLVVVPARAQMAGEPSLEVPTTSMIFWGITFL
jgi:hypothetical protein